MTSVREPLRRRWTGPGFETFGTVFGFVYTFLAGNFLLAAANAPLLVVLALVEDPLAAWPFFLALSLTIVPSLAGAFSAFRALGADGTAVTPVSAFLRSYKRSFRRTAPLGLGATAVLMFLFLDLTLVQFMPAAAVLVPLIVVAAAAAVCITVTVTAGLVLLPEARLKSLAKAAVYICVRRWYLSLALLALSAIILGAVLVQPVLGVALAPAPLLFIIWSNTSWAYSAALRHEDPNNPL